MHYMKIRNQLLKYLDKTEFNLFYSNRIIKIQLNLKDKKENESEIRNEIIKYIENRIRFIFSYESMNYNSYISEMIFRNKNKDRNESKYKFNYKRHMNNNSFIHIFNKHRHMNFIHIRYSIIRI